MEGTVARPWGVKHSLHILLKSLIDYAGLFPPAGLPMAQAVANYARYKNESPYSWILGKFIVPASRLAEFEQAFEPNQSTWHISALVGQNVTDDLARVTDFNQRHRFAAVIDSLECKASSAEEIVSIRKQLPEGMICYFEIPGGDPLLIDAIAKARSRAKIRTGGLTEEMFPAAGHVIEFLQTCFAANVPFKATAGLHHPLRCTKPLTYEKDAPVGAMHGFLNVFLAAAAVLEGLPKSELEMLLLDGDPVNFQFDEGSIRWRSQRISQAHLLEARALAASFGSCSFEEPMDDLRALNLL